jgi:hypothetical protein
VNCSGCGGKVLEDAGFCRNCGAILRGKAARASVVPSPSQSSVSPSAGSPEPPSSTLDAYGQPAQGFTAPPGAGLYSPVISPPTKRATDAQLSGKYAAGNDRRMRRHMLAFDYGIIAASAVVLLSTTVNWYQTSVVLNGVRVVLTRHLLSGNAGIQRPLVPIVAALTVVEVVLNMARLRTTQQAWRLHRGAVMLLCVLEFVLVVSCMLSSPLSADSLANIGISINTGPGGWIALCGASVGVIAAFGRMFAGRSALGQSRSMPSRSGGPAGP